ncbi:response regulator transcription factor [Paenibacillus filicis]|uniref:Response regulator transcription factor n=1 Tax=Paenibacillus filicis TaxID=669464 RepID=A0ABU9DJW6_9BACL
MSNRILLVEDDQEISEMIVGFLAKEGYTVECAYDGEQGVRMVRASAYDLIVLDLMLPRLGGLELLRIIRDCSLAPVLILSAKDSEVDKALGLGLGADDYMAKPFSMIELTARIQAGIRRATRYAQAASHQSSQPEAVAKTLEFGELRLEPDTFSVFKDGRDLKLTAKEFQILKLFLTHPKKVFTKANLYESIWNEPYMGDENVINVQMRRLREKIEEDPSSPCIIQTVWGIGYKLGGER